MMKYLNEFQESNAKPVQAKRGNNGSFELNDHRESSILQRKQVEGLSGNKPFQLKSEVIQLVTAEEIETSMRNIGAYSSLLKSYAAETIIKVLKAKDLRVRGHASGGAGDHMNDATRQDLDVLAEELRKDKAASSKSEERKHYASAAAASSSSSKAMHQTAAEKAATDAKKAEKEAKVKAAKHAKWAASQQ